MVRALKIFAVFLVLASVPALVYAADIFIGAGKGKDGKALTETPRIFLKKKTPKKTQSKTVANLKRSIDTSGLLSHSVESMKLASYWQKSGRKPRTVEERLLYASAMRSDERALMGRRRVALFDYLQKKQYTDREERLAQKRKEANKVVAEKGTAKKSGKKVVENAVVATQKKKRRLYVSPAKAGPLKKPPRVFKNFR